MFSKKNFCLQLTRLVTYNKKIFFENGNLTLRQDNQKIAKLYMFDSARRVTATENHI